MVSDSEKQGRTKILDFRPSPRLELERIQMLFPILVVSRQDDTILYMNEVASRFFAVPAEAAVGMDIGTFWPADGDRAAFFHEVLDKGQVSEHETCLLTFSGEKRYVLLSANQSGTAEDEAVYTVFTDITLKKEAEEALIQSKRRQQDLHKLMKLMSDTMPDLIWAKDLDDRYLFANRAICEKLLRCREGEDPLGKTDIYFAQRARARGELHTFGEICVNSDVIVRESLQSRKFLEDGLVNGEYKAFEVHKAPLLDDDGNLIGTVGAGRDVTLDLHTQNELRRSEALYRLLADNVRDVIWTTDDMLNITYVTPSIEELMGFSPEEFIHMAKEERLTPYFRRHFRVVARLLLKEARRQNPITRLWEFEWYHKDGHPIWVETSTSAIYNDAGDFTGFVCVTRETTKKVHAQNELKKAKEEALMASNAKSEFLANMSHEIRTPMNGVLGMLQLLQKTPLSDEQRGYVETALCSGTSLLKIISDILDFSKIEAGKLELEKTTFSLRPLIESITASFENLICHERVRLQAVIADGIPERIIGDETRLRQILFNLIGNAVKFTEHGTITVRLRAADQNGDQTKLLFEVEDTGIGVARDKLASLFEPFVQVDGSYRRRYPGTGLGLSIVKRLVELMGGEIAIDSESGQGTVISFHILVNIPPQPVAVTPCPATPLQRAATGHQEILVVEDDGINGMVITAMLKKIGHVPTLVTNGQKALEILHERGFDCILMDIQMPHMDGMETARAIRAGDASRNIPIIALTAHAMKGDRERFLEAGMNDYLTKPVKMSDLVAVLRGHNLDGAPN